MTIPAFFKGVMALTVIQPSSIGGVVTAYSCKYVLPKYFTNLPDREKGKVRDACREYFHSQRFPKTSERRFVMHVTGVKKTKAEYIAIRRLECSKSIKELEHEWRKSQAHIELEVKLPGVNDSNNFLEVFRIMNEIKKIVKSSKY